MSGAVGAWGASAGVGTTTMGGAGYMPQTWEVFPALKGTLKGSGLAFCFQPDHS